MIKCLVSVLGIQTMLCHVMQKRDSSCFVLLFLTSVIQQHSTNRHLFSAASFKNRKLKVGGEKEDSKSPINLK